MATLTRPHHPTTNVDDSFLRNSIPNPFPSREERELFLHEDLLEELAQESVDYEVHEDDVAQAAESSQTAAQQESSSALLEIMPSIAYVQTSCFLTLNNLFSHSINWQPIVPDRRHSMPSQSTSVSPGSVAHPSSALHTLMINLRTRDGDLDGKLDLESVDDASLFDELRARVEALAPSLQQNDAYFARVLISLLSHFNQLPLAYSVPTTRSKPGNLSAPSPPEAGKTVNLLATLKRQLSDLQIERRSKPDVLRAGSPPVQVVETALLWSKIDDELETVVSLCKERTEGLQRLSVHLPPQYDARDYLFDTPPEYDSETRTSVHIPEIKLPQGTHTASPVAQNEKMRLDFEAVTIAIDRLYMAAPQLHNQRVELKSAKVEQMAKARREGSQSVTSKGKQSDMSELENMFDLLDKASGRRLVDQSVILDAPLKAKLEMARRQDSEQRDAFVEKLVQHSGSGRYRGQDAILHAPKDRDLNALVSLPEFIREPVPPPEIQKLVAGAMIRTSSEAAAQAPSNVMSSFNKGSRNRSISAPPLSWLRPSSRSGHAADSNGKKQSPSRPGSSNGKSSPMPVPMEISYVAEHHETLQHILVFLSISGAAPASELSAEVLPTADNGTEGDLLVVRNSSVSSPPLKLPVRIAAGSKNLSLRNGYYELKLSITCSQSQSYSEQASVPLMDATQLSGLKPTKFVCTSCSLPLVHSSGIREYRDLPSEHWEELVEAWMCHADQKLHEQISKHGRGFWPGQGQALVGGSYILFDDSSVVKNTISTRDRPKRADDWRLVRCMCGAMVGRCQERMEDDKVNTMYRLVKYAIRPVSPTARPQRVPLSAFIIEDMNEYVQAHATYRFVISDEEDEQPRLLIWLFKPSLQLSYMIPKEYFLKRHGSIHVAKVLYKVVRPSTRTAELKELLNKYPGFSQAEYIFYPGDVCHRLSGMLLESTRSYPESMRTMTGLDVGWLHRA